MSAHQSVYAAPDRDNYSDKLVNDIFWLRKGVLAGSAGPNRVPWNPADFSVCNIQRILSVNDGALVREEELLALGIVYACFPLSDAAPPEEGDIHVCASVLPAALEFVLSPLQNDGATLVHCSSGKDRTGMFMSYYLSAVEGYSPQNAISEVRRVRSIALSAQGWEQLTLDVLNHMAE